ncbi:fumarylacetoacetate hydrolase family protein [Amnibacterium setariae]|uniref:Fumarylacetoacetate hydrolase family protein n=1 Tax=Amnibacterium setariae TaxID=2306585 RepID=A0A3A1U6W0_9MICO|nr:fumarylacetoacetate hydrolase family protein [Amnibacterium setariae]RIX28654.1 fumarylacetoacetate hydrolase family protein [Amnibacterium setariae]
MRIANLHERLVLLHGGRAHDVAEVSGGRFGPAVQDVYERWDEFRAWASGTSLHGGAEIDPAALGAPTPAPRQLFGIGLNYRDHAAEAGFETPAGLPPVFTKFATAITGPNTRVALPHGDATGRVEVDWEVELAVVIGRVARRVPPQDAWAHVAGLTVAQDLSERVLQMAGPAPQFSLGKSHPGFLPLGPWLVTTDELPDPDALRLSCAVNGQVVQDGTTADLIVDVPHLIAGLSAVLPLLPGDLILTGTPAGVGMGRTPRRFLAEGDRLVSRIEHLGQMVQTFE